MLSKKKEVKTVAILVYSGVSMLELTAAYSTFNGMRMAKYDVAVVAEHLQPVDSDTPMKIMPHKTIQDLPTPSVLVVMGGGLSSLQVLCSETLRTYLTTAASSADHVIGVGTGALPLAACGLLHGRLATTHWAYAGLLEVFGARFERQRWVEDGKFITCAGGTGGMDMGLQFLARHAGEQNARLLQLFAEYDPAPPYGGIDWERVDRDAPVPFSISQLKALHSALTRAPEVQSAVQRWAEALVAPA
jgi:transcriptional regulator GlxA family with amidase domain